eukprot:TRINITY_DN9051_c0_g2_i1.p1 TRINITY_DN9051_c0_g2~~TRINITY_DN9051_c0_g2_i1.p1  ORF type:complete len:296 (-),score=46.27 TRINITY_DN9051_c0_g2_i1:89-976(-)
MSSWNQPEADSSQSSSAAPATSAAAEAVSGYASFPAQAFAGSYGYGATPGYAPFANGYGSGTFAGYDQTSTVTAPGWQPAGTTGTATQQTSVVSASSVGYETLSQDSSAWQAAAAHGAAWPSAVGAYGVSAVPGATQAPLPPFYAGDLPGVAYGMGASTSGTAGSAGLVGASPAGTLAGALQAVFPQPVINAANGLPLTARQLQHAVYVPKRQFRTPAQQAEVQQAAAAAALALAQGTLDPSALVSFLPTKPVSATSFAAQTPPAAKTAALPSATPSPVFGCASASILCLTTKLR